MKESKEKRIQNKNVNSNKNSLASFVKNYARNCRYSFNRMLSI